MANNGPLAALGRILSGKPAFENETNAPMGSGDKAGGLEPKYIDEEGSKIFPKVYIKDVNFQSNDEYAELWVDVVNHSPYKIHIDKIVLLGKTTELDYNLEPGGSRQLLAYKGEALKTKPDSRAELWYKIIDNDDYFMNRHTMIYDVDAEGIFQIVRFDAANVPFDT